MLTEEALILFTALAGGVLLVLGALELLWPTRPRHPQRPDAGGKDPWRRARGRSTAQATPTVARPGAPVPATRVTRLPRRDTRAGDAKPAPSPDAAVPAPPSAPPAPPPADPTPETPVGVDAAAAAPPTSASDDDGDLTPYEAALAAQAETTRPDPLDGAGSPAGATPSEGTGSRAGATPVPAATPPDEPEPVQIERVVRGDKGSARERRQRERRAQKEAPEPAAAEPAPETSIVERCFTLYMDREYAQAVALASKALAHQPDDLPRNEAAGLWGVLALAKQANGDELEARAAFEKAIAVAAPDDRRTWQRHLASLAMKSGQAHLARARNRDAADGADRVAAVRAAAEWFEVGVAASPDDAAMAEHRAIAHASLWPTYEEVVPGLIQRQEFGEARRLLREALTDEDCPAPQQSAFRELLSATFSGEVGQLTAEAIANMQDAKEGEALAALERAVALLEQIPDGGLSPKRREELERRLWWGYTKLGLRLVDAAQFDEAIEPLFEALRLAGAGADRQAETRGALVQALEGLVETRVRVIRQIASEGDRDTALVQSEKLWALLRSSLEQGLSQDDLAGPLGKTQKLFEQLRKNRA